MFFILTLSTPFIKVDYHLFFPDNATPQFWQAAYYDDQRPEEQKIHAASIPSAVVDAHFIPLFIRYDVKRNDQIIRHCEGYVPSKKTGIRTGIRLVNGGLNINSPDVVEADPERLLNCLTNFYAIYINDSLVTDLNFWFEQRSGHDEHGIRTMIDTRPLPAGKNTLQINYRQIEEEDLITQQRWAIIPFWIDK